jgi:hypothetical protein
MMPDLIASSALYWSADEVGSQALDLSLHYTSCHISSICFGRNPRDLVLCAESGGRSGSGRLGNLLEGLQEVVWATN